MDSYAIHFLLCKKGLVRLREAFILRREKLLANYLLTNRLETKKSESLEKTENNLESCLLRRRLSLRKKQV